MLTSILYQKVRAGMLRGSLSQSRTAPLGSAPDSTRQSTWLGVRIVRCFGSGSILSVPEQMEGLPVIALADHCFAREPSDLYKKEDLFLWKDSDLNEAEQISPADGLHAAASDGGDETAFCADMLTELILPPRLLEIGSYAFYGCENLTRLRLPLGLKMLGSGTLTGCGRLTELDFYACRQEPGGQEPGTAILREIISDLDHEARIRVFSGIFAEDEYRGLQPTDGEKPGSREAKPLYVLIFPGFYEESIENTPARIIEIHYEGTGYKYRQCFRRGKIEFDRYDDLFPAARAMETLPTAMRIAGCRLAYPYHLRQEAADVYLSFLREHSGEFAKSVLQEEDLPLLHALMEREYFTLQLLEDWITMAAAAHSAEAVSLLMEYRRVHYPPKQKTYDF